MSQPLSNRLNQQTSSHLRALVLGNSINHYRAKYQDADTSNQTKSNALDEMLMRLCRAHQGDEVAPIPKGIALTEFYDALDLISKPTSKHLQKEFCDLMASCIKPIPAGGVTPILFMPASLSLKVCSSFLRQPV